MSQSTTERVSQTALSAISRVQSQLDDTFRKLQEIAPNSMQMTFKHPQGLDKQDHYAVFQRNGENFRLIGVYPSEYPAEAIKASGMQNPGNLSELVIVSTRSLWQPESQ